MDTHNIGSFIITCRKKKEMTRKELADQLGVKEQLVKKWETNLSFPKGTVLSSLCDCLDIRVEELILGEHIEQEELLEKSEQIILELYHKKSDDAFFIMMFDINGLMPPNRWGKDIYGIKIFDGGKIKPFGEELSMDELRKDCSESGTGVSCSYYYKIGGGFDE